MSALDEMLPYLKCKCAKQHDFEVGLMPWSFSWKEVKCPECKKPPVSVHFQLPPTLRLVYVGGLSSPVTNRDAGGGEGNKSQ